MIIFKILSFITEIFEALGGDLMKNIHIRDIVIGQGKPKICIPIVATDIEEAKVQATEIMTYPVDVVELRADFLDKCFDIEYTIHVIKAINDIISVPLIYTFRTKKEGGEKEVSCDDYVSLIKKVLESGTVDLIDVEMFTGDEIVSALTKYAHKCGARVIVSNHEFTKTPIKIDLILRLVKMQTLGADIAKIAVMPKNKMDVLTLLEATAEAYEEYMDIPIVTMSMGKYGMISRMTGEVFGSCITFGCVGKPSAPGQIEANRLSTALDIIHRQIQ